jgi:7-cyano-7-deazaguanine synthase
MPKKRNKNITVLLSGGLDSAALTGQCVKKGYTVWPVYVRSGLRWERVEIYWIKRFLKAAQSNRIKPLAIATLSLEGAYAGNWSQKGQVPGARSDDRAVFLPARNLLLIIRALLRVPEVNHVALATLQGNPFPDGRPAYFRRLAALLSQSFLKPIQISVPFRNWTKKKVIQSYRDWPLHLSFSCINPKGLKHCGRCNKCAERKKAFRTAGVKDETDYARG